MEPNECYHFNSVTNCRPRRNGHRLTPPLSAGRSPAFFPGSLEGNLVRHGGRPCAPRRPHSGCQGRRGHRGGGRLGAAGLFPAQRGDFRAPGGPTPPFLAPGILGRTEVGPGSPRERPRGGPPKPVFPLSFCAPRRPAQQPEVSSQRCRPPAEAQGLPYPRKENSWPHPGPFDSVRCSEQGGAASADCPAEGRSRARRSPPPGSWPRFTHL